MNPPIDNSDSKAHPRGRSDRILRYPASGDPPRIIRQTTDSDNRPPGKPGESWGAPTCQTADHRAPEEAPNPAGLP
jgi:hypothetical protein